ncbi:MAG: PBP1A family penicillin-binding protein [Acidobacteriota bacterium]|nr:PBP1A family penicillin-binding protein [Acidobacteriota bacterium]
MGTVTPGVRVIKVSPRDRFARFFTRKPGIILLCGMAVLAVVSVSTLAYFYVQYGRLIDKKLKDGPFVSTSRIFAAPETVGIGDPLTPSEVVARLRRSAYNESRTNRIGWFNVKQNSVEIFPGPQSFFEQDAGVISFGGGKITRIVSLSDNTSRNQYQLEPQLITNLYDRNREKRRLVKYEEIPEVLIHAVVSIEDKRFFRHGGFDPFGMIRAVYVDVKDRQKTQGASTLSQQLAKMLFLKPEKSYKRKLEELIITIELEQKLSKKEIFEFYCNQIDLGHKGSFTIRGFGEAAQAYFGKNLRSISTAEAATLAGMVQRPSYFNPYRHADRVVERRNVVLSLMRQNEYIDDRAYGIAVDSPLKLSTNSSSESSEAPYFVDLLHDELQNRFQDYDFQTQAYRVYSSLDMDLQRAAGEAVRAGMASVDEQLRKQKRFKGVSFPEPQVALIALDPHTGQIKAIVGGRNYATSQLNHITSKRQPGSIFKPWVYAAAMNTAINGGPRTLTPATTVVDEPTTFWFDGKPYEPGNFKHEFYGVTTLRRALAKSMNIATVKVAEMVGYGAIVNLAKKAGINEDVHATPSVALGSYEATPIEMAGSYTVFANKGTYVRPTFVSEIKGSDGKNLYEEHPETKQILDPRVNYLMVSMLEEVMRSGTAANVRSRGFTVPAAGKTGTSDHDGWFAGFTSELLCVVWVGFDDNRDLNLEGAHSALPIWADFMKRALQYRSYHNAKPFAVPEGIVSIKIDPESGMPATAFCPETRNEVFVSGTEPVGSCPLHSGSNPMDNTNVSGWDVPVTKPAPPSGSPTALSSREEDPVTVDGQDGATRPKKKSFFRRVFGK